MKNRRTFTLIELLIVIAIVAILMTILLPALKKAKDTAMRIACTGNMRQIGIGDNNYMTDFSDWMPTFYNNFGTTVCYQTQHGAEIDKQLVKTYWPRDIRVCPKNTPENNPIPRNSFNTPYFGAAEALIDRNIGFTYTRPAIDMHCNEWAPVCDFPKRTGSTFAIFVKPAASGSAKKWVQTGDSTVGYGIELVATYNWVPAGKLPMASDTLAYGQNKVFDSSAGWYYITGHNNGQGTCRDTYWAPPQGSNHLYLDGHVTWIPWQRGSYNALPLFYGNAYKTGASADGWYRRVLGNVGVGYAYDYFWRLE